MYQRLVKSRSFNLSDTDPEPLLTVQIPGCALRPINIPVITTTASTLIKFRGFPSNTVTFQVTGSIPDRYRSCQAREEYATVILLLLHLNIIMRVIASIM